LSLLLLATRCRCSSAAQGWNGRPSGNAAPRFQNWLSRTASGTSSVLVDVACVAGVGSGAPGGRLYCQTPERSGLPSVVLATGPDRLGLPSAFFGTPGVG